MSAKKHKCEFHWDEARGYCNCVITYKNEQYLGHAFTHPVDMDMKSRKVGEEIAYNRAVVDMLKSERKKLKLELKGLNQLYYSMKHSPHFNPKSYEAKMLYRQIKMHTEDIESTNELIKDVELFVSNYINKKDELYEKIRANRNRESAKNVINEDKGE